uniref:Uncharacterized protein n=1 Tax=Arundo donax TaxID=35708 RepID=A0A0A9SGK1_ARUDO
MEGQKKCFTGV